VSPGEAPTASLTGMGRNDLLHDPIRHNSWATGSLIEFCRAQNLTAEQLQMTGSVVRGQPLMAAAITPGS
jgi:hypothetical protein